MPTHDYVIDNQATPAFRSDLNSVLQAILSQNSNATAPTTTIANMLWYDTTNNQIRKRNEANSNWVTLGTIDEGLGTFTPSGTPSQAIATWLVGTSTTESLISPAKLDDKVADSIGSLSTFTKQYLSSSQTITSAGLLTLAHSLGAVPKIVLLELTCLAAEANYAVNDVITVGVSSTTTSTNKFTSVSYGVTNISIRYSDSASVFTAGNKTTGAAVGLTNGNWSLRARAFA